MHATTTLNSHTDRRNARTENARYPRKRHVPLITERQDVDQCHYCHRLTGVPAYFLRFPDGGRAPVCTICRDTMDTDH